MTQREVWDIHSHVLYGMDDGPSRPEDMAAILRATAAQGVTELIATPHAEPGVQPFHMERFRQRLLEANDLCRREGLTLRVWPGAELLYTEYTCAFLRDGRVPTLLDGRFVLVEFYPSVPFDLLEESLRRLDAAGYHTILAHAERYRCLRTHPGRVELLKDAYDVGIQINASTVLGGGDFRENWFFRKMLKRGLVDHIASDTHNLTSRPPCMGLVKEYFETGLGKDYVPILMGGLPLDPLTR